ncbi:PatB family C-S lyase [Alisedimentitalea sp. MJ-SS2]|uniref:MalY/PatB family protein n=1 Tax=Aliisedimentitalea sp. MJ-SS2 TaxID=3049795 RepID=UPI00290B1BEB|nr:PatB family C-S lyase [Alisedimentitalea sp. MJ-SS2]MDU8926522.1 PatB family C-S lyase [Alisedimentitalea sp. MJ-SS2]
MNFDEEIDRRAVPALKWHGMVLGEGNEHIFPAGVADMDFRAPDSVRAAMQARLDHGVFGYETVQPDLMPALCDWMEGRHGWDIDPGHILRAPNILNALAIAASIFTEPGDAVIVQPPVFFDFFDILNENHREIVENPLVLRDGRYVMDFDDLEAKTARRDVKMIYLCNPHNPMGRVWTREELTRLGDICAENGVIVVSDEMHGDLVLPGREAYVPFAALGEAYAQNSITCLSPAKTFNIASCSSAFTVVPDAAWRKAFQVENSRLTVNKNNGFANVAMVAAWREGGEWLDAVLVYLDQNLALMRERISEMNGVGMIEPEAGFLAWVDFRELGLAPKALTALLKGKAGWAPTRGEAFGPGGEGFARVNFACRRKTLAAALDRLEAALAAAHLSLAKP